MNKTETLRQLQSRIDRRSNYIDYMECQITGLIDSSFYEKAKALDALPILRQEQALDKRIYGKLIHPE